MTSTAIANRSTPDPVMLALYHCEIDVDLAMDEILSRLEAASDRELEAIARIVVARAMLRHTASTELPESVRQWAVRWLAGETEARSLDECRAAWHRLDRPGDGQPWPRSARRAYYAAQAAWMMAYGPDATLAALSAAAAAAAAESPGWPETPGRAHTLDSAEFAREKEWVRQLADIRGVMEQ